MRQKIHCVIPHFSKASARTTLFAPHNYNCSISNHYTQPTLRYLSTKSSSDFNKRNYFPAEPPTQSSRRISNPFSTATHKMASDDAYMSFLDKANEDVSGGKSQQGASVKTQTVHSSLSVPKALKSVDANYVSETDEPFEPVALKWDGAAKGAWPSADELSSLISPDTDLSKSISTLSPSSFDPKNQYSAVLDAVRAAVENDSDKSEVKVYRVQVTNANVEYWVLALDKSESRLVGLRAKSVET